MFKVEKIKAWAYTLIESAVTFLISGIVLFMLASSMSNGLLRIFSSFLNFLSFIFLFIGSICISLGMSAYALYKSGRVCPKCQTVCSGLVDTCPKCKTNVKYAKKIDEFLAIQASIRTNNPTNEAEINRNQISKRFCSSCGQEIVDEAVFCPKCGRQV